MVYWNNIPSPYMVDRFNALADRGRMEFEAWFSTRTEPGRSWKLNESEWRFDHRYLRGVGSGQHRVDLPVRLFASNRPDVLVSLYASPAFVVGSTLARLGGTKVAYWTEVTFDSWVTRSRWKEWLKRQLFTGVDGVMTPGSDGRRFARRYGTPADRIHIVPHAIDVAHFREGAALARHQRDEIRSEIGVSGCTFIYVGRLWERGKGLDHLIDAFAEVVRDGGTPASLLLVGDGPDDGRLRRRVADLGLADNVVFAGFISAVGLPRYHAASDVFVFPTLGDPYGLAVDEAMAAGLPVIATTAAGELDLRLHHGENGLVVPPADTAALANAMKQLARDEDARKQLGAKSALMIDGRTPEQWARDFERAVGSMLVRVNPRRR